MPGGACTHWKAPPCHGAHPNPTFDTVTVTGNGDSTGFSTPIGINDTGLIARGVDVEGTEIGVRGVATGGESLPVIGVWGAGAMGVVGQVSAQTNLPSNNVLPSVGVYGVGGPLPSLNENDLPYLAGVLGVGGSNSVGVVGRAGAGTADGVQGFGSGTFSGVAGFGDPSSSGTGVFGQGRGNGAPGVRGIGAGGPNTTPSGAVGVYGQGGPGSAGVAGTGAVGGSFGSDSNGPQLHLVPSSTRLEDNSSLLNNGQVGDLYLYSQAQEVGTTGTYDYTTILWLCIAPKVPNGQALWAQVQLGDTIGG